MKQQLLFLILVLFLGFRVQSQIPPPCGLSSAYVCDDDEDGQVTVDLTELFPFFFCPLGPEHAVNFYPITYYLSEDDANAETNPILNPEIYVTSSDQVIYKRVNPIDPDSYSVLIYSEGLEILLPPTPNIPTPLVVCNSSNDGYATFSLYDKIDEIRSSQNHNYEIRFFESLSDAENLINPIPNIYDNVVPYQQTIYASMSLPHLGQSIQDICIDVVPLDLIVGECEDISVNLLPGPTNPRPGFDYLNTLFIQNLGSNSTTGSVEFIHDASVLFLNAVSSNPNYVITTTSNGFVLDFMDLAAGDSEHITIHLSCPASIELGTTLTNNAINLNTSDYDQTNDVSSLNQVVIGSYDPNDKLESHGPTIYVDDFTNNDYLYYTIRFQNIGTADAINIKIVDILDNQLDESTFQMIRASHSYTVVRSGNYLEWNFYGINLPSENVDEANSHGYVYFKIKPQPGYSIGDIIPNYASIYFDANVPIVTNTFETEFEQTLVVEESSPYQFNIFPNPANDVVNIQMNESFIGSLKVAIFDIQGKQVLSQNSLNERTMQLDVSSLESGLYFIKMKNGTNEMIKKLIVN